MVRRFFHPILEVLDDVRQNLYLGKAFFHWERLSMLGAECSFISSNRTKTAEAGTHRTVFALVFWQPTV
jgi:hypothetical protein